MILEVLTSVKMATIFGFFYYLVNTNSNLTLTVTCFRVNISSKIGIK